MKRQLEIFFRRGNPPLLRNNLCVVLWRTLGASPSFGHTVVEVEEQEQDADEKEEKKEDEVEDEKPLPSYPVTAVAEVGEVVMHDFAATPLACIPVKVKVIGHQSSGTPGPKKESQSSGTLVQYSLAAQERGARVAGATAGLGWVTPSITLDLQLGVSVARYILRGIS